MKAAPAGSPGRLGMSRNRHPLKGIWVVIGQALPPFVVACPNGYWVESTPAGAVM